MPGICSCDIQYRGHCGVCRYVILRVLLDAGDGLVCIDACTGEDGAPDLRVRLDRSKIHTVGKVAIGNFLLKLQVHTLDV